MTKRMVQFKFSFLSGFEEVDEADNYYLLPSGADGQFLKFERVRSGNAVEDYFIFVGWEATTQPEGQE